MGIYSFSFWMSLTKGTVVHIMVVLYVYFPVALCFITELWKDEKSHSTHAEVEVRGGNMEFHCRDDAFSVNCVLPGLVIKLWRGAVFVMFLLPPFQCLCTMILWYLPLSRVHFSLLRYFSGIRLSFRTFATCFTMTAPPSPMIIKIFLGIDNEVRNK